MDKNVKAIVVAVYTAILIAVCVALLWPEPPAPGPLVWTVGETRVSSNDVKRLVIYHYPDDADTRVALRPVDVITNASERIEFRDGERSREAFIRAARAFKGYGGEPPDVRWVFQFVLRNRARPFMVAVNASGSAGIVEGRTARFDGGLSGWIARHLDILEVARSSAASQQKLHSEGTYTLFESAVARTARREILGVIK